MKKLFFAVATLAVAGTGFWLSLHFTDDSDTGEEGPPPMMPAKVEVAVVDRRTMQETVEYAGSVEALESVTIVPKVTGIIERIEVDLGDRVEKGDPLVTIDDREFVQRLKQAKANLQLAEAQLERGRILWDLAKSDHARTTDLVEEGLAADQALETVAATEKTARADVDLAQAEVARMRATVDEAQLDIESTRIVSPLDGSVETRRVDPGALASPSTPLLILVRTSPVKVVVHVPESDVLLAEKGRVATVSVAEGAVEYVGEVGRVAPTLDVSTRTTVVEVTVPNLDGRFRPGMSADVTIVAREAADALVIPEEALIPGDEGLQTFVVKDGVAHKVPIKVGIQHGGMAQVVEGLEQNDLVIVQGQFLVRDGAEVAYETVREERTDS